MRYTLKWISVKNLLNKITSILYKLLLEIYIKPPNEQSGEHKWLSDNIQLCDRSYKWPMSAWKNVQTHWKSVKSKLLYINKYHLISYWKQKINDTSIEYEWNLYFHTFLTWI